MLSYVRRLKSGSGARPCILSDLTRWGAALGVSTAIAMALGGCAIFEAEKNERGGFVAKIADDSIIQVDTPTARVLRVTFVFGFLAETAARNIDDEIAATAAVRYIEKITRKLGEMDKKARSQCAVTPKLCAIDENHFMLETDMVELTDMLWVLAKLGLPDVDLAKLQSDIVTQNYLGVLGTLWKLTEYAIKSSRYMMAMYRDGIDIAAHAALSGLSEDDFIKIYKCGTASIGEIKESLTSRKNQIGKTVKIENYHYSPIFRVIDASYKRVKSLSSLDGTGLDAISIGSSANGQIPSMEALFFKSSGRTGLNASPVSGAVKNTGFSTTQVEAKNPPTLGIQIPFDASRSQNSSACPVKL